MDDIIGLGKHMVTYTFVVIETTLSMEKVINTGSLKIRYNLKIDIFSHRE